MLIKSLRNGFVFICLLTQTFISFGQNHLFYENDSISLFIYHYRFNEVVSYIRKNIATEANPEALQAYSYYWEALSGNEPEKNLEQAGELIQKIRKAISGDPYLKPAMHLLSIRILITQKKYVSAFFATGELKSFFEEHPLEKQNELSVLMWGLYHYYATEVRKSGIIYRGFLSSWPPSYKSEGMKLLFGISNSSNVFIRNETHYFLSRIYLESENEPLKARALLVILKESFPENTIYEELYLSLLKKANQLAEYNQEQQRFYQFMQDSGLYTTQQIQHFSRVNPLIDSTTL